MSQSQSETAAAGATQTGEAVSLLDQVVGATKQTEPDHAQELVKTLVQEALSGTVTFAASIAAGLGVIWNSGICPPCTNTRETPFSRFSCGAKS